MTYDQVWWPILRICALYLTHPKCTHTHSEHTPGAVGSHFMLRRPGSSWGFCALLKGTSVVVLRMERALYIHSPHLQFLPARDSNSQPFDYESDSLTIRPRLLPIQVWKNMRVSKWWQNVHFWVNYSFNPLAIVKCRNFIQYTYGSFYRNVHFWHWQDVLTCNFF